VLAWQGASTTPRSCCELLADMSSVGVQGALHAAATE